MRAILLTLIVLLTPIVQAGNTGDVSCRFIKMNAGEKLSSILVTSEDKDEIMSPLPANSVSPKITCPTTDNTLSILSSADRNPVATVKIPKHLSSALLVFFKTETPGEESGEGEKEQEAEEKETKEEETEALSWQVLVIDDSGKNEGSGGGLMANCNSTEARYTIGSDVNLVQPLETGYFEMPKDRDTFNMAQVKIETHEGDKWKLTSENSLRFLPGVRYLIISFPDYRSGRSRVNIIQDSK